MTGNLPMIWCCGCGRAVAARLTNGREIYPHRPDLAALPFWKCDGCGNHVGCHNKSRKRARPLGNIATPELRAARQHIHAILDPIWKSRRMARATLYAMLSQRIGREYHTAEITTIEEARAIYRAVRAISEQQQAKGAP
jgi:hypothetical protein